MQLCYVDESGDDRNLPAGSAQGNITPVVVIAGLAIDQKLLEIVTRDFIKIKSRFYPNLTEPGTPPLGKILAEIKGSDLRRALRDGAPRRNRTQAIGVLDALINMLEYRDARIFGRVWVKEPGETCDGRAIYTFSVQDICATFQNHLEDVGDDGLIIADSRNPTPNAAVSHSIFTQKFKTNGDRYPRILEMPTFGHSQNHAGIQIADLLCSALLFPMATCRYCYGHMQNVHVDDGFVRITERYGARLKALQHRYTDDTRKRRGGITVSDPLGHKHGGLLFVPRKIAETISA